MNRSQENVLRFSIYPIMDSMGQHHDGILLNKNPSCILCDTKECLEAKKFKDFDIFMCHQGLLSLKITIFDEAYVIYGLKNDYSNLSKNEKKKYPERIYFKDIEAIKAWRHNSNEIYSQDIDYNKQIEKNDSIFIHDIKKTFSTIYRKVEQYIKSTCYKTGEDIEQCIKDGDPNFLGIYKAVSLVGYQFDMVDYISNPESVTYGNLKRIKVYKAIDKLVRIFQTTSKAQITLEGSSHNEIYLYDSFMTLVFVLLDNAIKYSLPSNDITVRINDYGGDVEVAITSYSPFINEKDRENIFQKYFRAHNDIVEGQGIGLYLAKIISDSLQAPIKVNSLSQTTQINEIDYSLMEFSFYVTNLE